LALFSIRCMTCQARLKVTDPAAIGEILSCPKCGSFVEVVAPPGYNGGAVDTSSPGATAQPLGAADRGSPDQGRAEAAQTKASSQAAPPDSPLADAPAGSGPLPPPAQSVVPPMASGAVNSPVQDLEDVLSEAASRLDEPPLHEALSPPTATDLAAIPSPAEVPGTIAGPPLVSSGAIAQGLPPGAAWVSPVEQMWRRRILLGVSGAIAVAAVVGLVVYLLSGGDRPDAPGVANPIAAAEPSSDDTISGADADDEPSQSTDQGAAGADPASAPSNSSPAEVAPRPPLQGTDAIGDPPGDSLAKANNPALPGKNVPPPIAVENPLGHPPGDQQLPPANESDPSDPGANEPDPNDTAAAENSDPEDVDPADPDPSGMGTAAPVPDEPRPQVDVAARLADPIAQIELPEMPLADFIAMMSQLSTISITLDLEALAEIGRAPATPVSVKLSETTVGDVLRTALQSQSLTLEVDGDQVLVTRPAGERSKQRLVKHAAGDLFDNRAEAQDLAGVVRKFVLPGTWVEDGGPGTIEVDGDSLSVRHGFAAHYQIVMLLEKLRTARGRPNRNRYYDRRNFQLATRFHRSYDRLQQPITVNFRSAPLRDIVAHLNSRGIGVRVLVDWHALSQQGVWPTSTCTLQAAGESLDDALRTMLAPRKLKLRAVDSGLVEITSAAALRDRAEVEFYPVGDVLSLGQSPEALVAKITQSLAPESWHAAGGAGLVHFDPPSRTLIVRAGQDVQVLLEQYLAELPPAAEKAAVRPVSRPIP